MNSNPKIYAIALSVLFFLKFFYKMFAFYNTIE